MTDEQPTANAAGPEAGFSSTEKVLGAAAAYRAPLLTGIAAGELARRETDPARRKQLENLSKAAFVWWGVGAALGLIVLVVVLVSFNAQRDGLNGGNSGPNSACRGGADTYDIENITYTGDDAGHWTATYPCVNGGMTTVPVPRSAVPGA